MAIVEALGNGLPVVYEQCPALESLTAPLPQAVAVSALLERSQELSRLESAVREVTTMPVRYDVPAELVASYGIAALRVATVALYRQLLRSPADAQQS